MALGLITSLQLVDNSSDGTTFDIACPCIVIAPGLARNSNFVVALLTTDTPAAMAAKIITGMLTFAGTQNVTLARTDVLLPSFVRGS